MKYRVDVITSAFVFIICAITLPAVPARAQAGNVFENLADLFETLSPFLMDEGNRSAAESAAEAAAGGAQDTLLWSGATGSLSEIRIEHHVNTGVKRAVGAEPITLGYGGSPREVLAASINRPILRKGVSEGFQISPEDTIFIWSSVKDGKLQHRSITKPFSQALTNEAIVLNADASTMDQLRSLQRNRTYEAAVDRLRRTANSEALAAKIAALNEARRNAKVRLEQIERTLKEQLERESRANASYETMRALAGVLSVTQMIAQASALSGGALDAMLSNDMSSSEVLEVTEDYVEDLRAGTEKARSAETTQRGTLQTSEQALDGELLQNGAPSTVIPPQY